jgi:uncharacterized protein
MRRYDYAFPFRIDPTSHQAAQSLYAAHVRSMIRQVLLTAPGERVCLPEFGCGLRQLIFAPYSEALVATARMQVQRALERWLAGHIQLRTVDVSSPDTAWADGQLLLHIEYQLIETRSNERIEVRVY